MPDSRQRIEALLEANRNEEAIDTLCGHRPARDAWEFALLARAYYQRGDARGDRYAATFFTDRAQTAGFDFVLYDGVAPTTLADVAAQLYVNCLPPSSGLTNTGTLDYPIIIDWERTHPATSRLSFDDVVVLEALKLSGAERSAALVGVKRREQQVLLESIGLLPKNKNPERKGIG